MNNKYLSGLLAGVLTAGVLQGSGGKANMPGLGGQQTPVIRAQSANELPEELQELFLAFSQSLAERGYQAQINVNPIQMPNQITRITFNEHGGMQSNEGAFDLPEMVLSESESLSTPVELTHLTIGENGETRQKVVTGKKQLDPFHMHTVQQYMGYVKKSDDKPGSSEDLKNLIQVNKNFEDQPERNRINVFPITKDNKGLYPKIQTQQIFGPSDYILPRMYQYIITYPVTKAEIESWVTKLRDMHTSKALTPIVFECQSLECFGYLPSLSDEIVKESEGFKIKSYCCGRAEASDLEHDPWGGETIKLLDDKPIIFGKIRGLEVDDADKALIKSPFNFQKAAMCEFTNISYEKYDIICKRHMKYELPFDDISFFRVDITGNSPEIQRQQLKVLSEDKRVLGIGFDQEKCHIIEAIGNIKCIDIVSFSEDIVMQKSPSISNYYTTNHENIYSLIAAASKSPETIYNTDGSYQTCGNRVLREKYQKYIKYVEDHNLEYLSGFINFDKKPDYLSNEEWQKVEILTKMVDEFVALADKY